jgi:hypothetical protein
MRGKVGRLIVLVGLLAALAVVLIVQWRPWAATPPSAGRQASSPAGLGTRGPVTVGNTVAPAVKLQALRAQRPEPEASQRNPFRLKPAALPPAPRPLPGTSASLPVLATDVPPPPPPPPPISLKFIGVVEGSQRTGRIAVLADGRDVFYGRDGDVIDGRYRIIRIGVESIEMSYVDGRGRQTIRLSGS